jgi:hypothetical protein
MHGQTKRTNNDLQNTTQKIKWGAHEPSVKSVTLTDTDCMHTS